MTIALTCEGQIGEPSLRTIGGGPQLMCQASTRDSSRTHMRILFSLSGLGQCSEIMSFVTKPSPPFQPSGGLSST